MSEQTTEVTQEAVETQQAPTGVQLQLQDLLLTAQIITLASQRGAFKPEEFSQVGGVYDRLVAFLKESGALQPAPAPADETSAEESSAE